MVAKACEFVDHGIEHASYFQGCGVAFTKFDACFTGIGCSATSAIDDCLELAAQSGYTIPGPMIQAALLDTVFGGEVTPEDSEEVYYHVSLRVH